MADAPRFTVYSSDGEYVADCKFSQDAASIVAFYEGGTIRDGHRKTVWREGAEDMMTTKNMTSPVAALLGYSYELLDDGRTLLRYDHRRQAYTGQIELAEGWTQTGVDEIAPDTGPWRLPGHG